MRSRLAPGHQNRKVSHLAGAWNVLTTLQQLPLDETSAPWQDKLKDHARGKEDKGKACSHCCCSRRLASTESQPRTHLPRTVQNGEAAPKADHPFSLPSLTGLLTRLCNTFSPRTPRYACMPPPLNPATHTYRLACRSHFNVPGQMSETPECALGTRQLRLCSISCFELQPRSTAVFPRDCGCAGAAV